MSTLAVVEEILRECAVPMTVKEIVERAGSRLPSKSRTPDTVVARDLSMSIKKKGADSMFVRTSPGRYTLRELVNSSATGILGDAIRQDRAGLLSARRIDDRDGGAETSRSRATSFIG